MLHLGNVFLKVLVEEPNISFSFPMMQGAKAIAEMMKKNSTLRIIELNNNLIDYSV